MKVKDLIKQLEQFDKDDLIKLYNVNYTDCRFDQNFCIKELCVDKSNEKNVVVMEIKHMGDWVI
nr:MAG TPA: hypothetical protein [Caudoviricetes sp.]